MQIRFMGSRDLVERIGKLISDRDEVKISENRHSDEVRYFVNLDDRTVASWLDLLENAEEPIQIDPQDLR